MKVILASASPRRKELLSKMNIDFTVVPSSAEEIIDEGLSPQQVAQNLSYLKAKDVFNSLNDKDCSLVIGADTIVVLDGVILGKPKDRAEAYKMLLDLSGKAHSVITGYTVVSRDKIVTDFDKTEVIFNSLSKSLIEEYLDSGLYVGKAGAYGIQDGFPLVKKFVGSFNNVVGFPTEKISNVLKSFGMEATNER